MDEVKRGREGGGGELKKMKHGDKWGKIREPNKRKSEHGQNEMERKETMKILKE